MHLHLAPNSASHGTSHLTDEQLTDMLLDQGTAAAHQHLDRCEPCRLELDGLRSSITDFNSLSLAWAEDQAPRRIPVPTRAALRWHATPTRAAIAAAALAAIFLAGAHERARESQLQSVASNLAAETSAQASTVADDNRLLMAIDEEIRLGQQTPAAVTALGLAPQAPAGTAADLEN